MTVYNGEKFLKEAIDSILNQTLTEFEFIIINDGSTDKSKNIIETYNDKRIIYIEQENKGFSKALNIAISHCKGKYIALIDQDDICLLDRFYNQFTYLESHQEISVLSGAVFYINETGNYLGRSFPITCPALIKKKLFNSGSVITHPGVMMRKKDFDSVGGYSEIIGDRFTDYHLWVKFSNKGYKIKNLSTVLLQYRINQSSISSGFFLNNYGVQVLIKIIKNEHPTSDEVNLLKSICQSGEENFVNREKAYKNTSNYLYHKTPFINENIKNHIFSLARNIVAFIH